MNRPLAAALSLALGLALAGSVPTARAFQAAPQSVRMAPAELKWMPAPPVLPKGIQIAVLHGNPFAKGFCIVRLRIPAHTVIPPHWHPTTESFSVLKGKLFVGMGDKVDKRTAKALPAMGFASLAPMHHHYVYTGKKAAVIDLSFYGPFQIHYVNPADDPSKASVRAATP